jgi:hypothetical protein
MRCKRRCTTSHCAYPPSRARRYHRHVLVQVDSSMVSSAMHDLHGLWLMPLEIQVEFCSGHSQPGRKPAVPISGVNLDNDVSMVVHVLCVSRVLNIETGPKIGGHQF